MTVVDDEYRIPHDDVQIEDGKDAAVGANSWRVPAGARVLDGRWCAAYPGFVNTHHHFYQTLTRNISRCRREAVRLAAVALRGVARIAPEAVEVSTRTALAKNCC